MPPGVFIFEDPPAHSIHRRLGVAGVYSPGGWPSSRPRSASSAAAASTRSSESTDFDLIADLGAQVPMRTIGMLLGIPEGDQEAIRDQVDASLRTEAGKPWR